MINKRTQFKKLFMLIGVCAFHGLDMNSKMEIISFLPPSFNVLQGTFSKPITRLSCLFVTFNFPLCHSIKLCLDCDTIQFNFD